METKFFEVRASATCVPIIATRLRPTNESEQWMLAHLGYGMDPDKQAQYIFVARLEGGSVATPNPYDETSPELKVVHEYLIEHFDEAESGAVLDADFIQGIRPAQRKSDRFWNEAE